MGRKRGWVVWGPAVQGPVHGPAHAGGRRAGTAAGLSEAVAPQPLPGRTHGSNLQGRNASLLPAAQLYPLWAQVHARWPPGGNRRGIEAPPLSCPRTRYTGCRVGRRNVLAARPAPTLKQPQLTPA